MTHEINLRPATRDDIFTGQLFKVNKVYFEYSADRTEIHGPFMIGHEMIRDTYHYQEMLCKLYDEENKLLVAHYEETEIKHLVKFELAKADNLKDFKGRRRINFSYFLYDNNVLNGPFTIHTTSNVHELKEYLDHERMWIIKSAFKQQEFRNEYLRKAS